jgi:hypothetical protein
MTNTMFFLFCTGIIGMILHFLIKLDSLNRICDGEVNWKRFFLLERFSILISLFVVLAAVLLSQEIRQLELAGKWLGLGMLSIGYTSQSLLVKVMNKIQSYTNDQIGGAGKHN